MNAYEMSLGVPHIVTRDSLNGTFAIGDLVWRVPGGLMTAQAMQQDRPEPMPISASEGMECVPDENWKRAALRRLQGMLDELEAAK